MADFVETANALRARLETFAALPIRWANDSRPADVATCPDGFVYAEVALNREGPATIGPAGSRTHRDEGTFDVFVYVPRGTLPGTCEAHAQALRNLFAIGAVDDVNVTGRTIGRGQIVSGPNGAHYAIPLTINFFCDRIE